MQIVRCESIEEIGEIRFAENLTFDGFIARMIGELNRVDGVDVEVQ